MSVIAEAVPILATAASLPTDISVALPSKQEVFTTVIPEKDTMIWQIEDFEAFRNAAKVSHIPPLLSPEFGGGCQVRLWPYEKEHIRGCVELPPSKWGKDGLTRFKVAAIKPDGKVITLRSLELRVARGRGATRFAHFRLSKKDFLHPIKYQHLVHDGALRLRLDMEYYPYDAPIFKGFYNTKKPESGAYDSGEGNYQGLLNDIENYCKDEPANNAQIRCETQVFPACIFLLMARSNRFRNILNQCGSTKGASAVTVNDTDAQTMKQLLTFVHQDSCEWVEDSAVSVENVIKLFHAAEAYQVPCLLTKTGETLSAILTAENVLEVWDAADKCSWEPLKEECIKYMDSIPGSKVVNMVRCASTSTVTTPRSCA